MQTTTSPRTAHSRALELLEDAQRNREILAELYRSKPLNYEAVGSVKAAIRADLAAADVFAALAVAEAIDRGRADR